MRHSISLLGVFLITHSIYTQEAFSQITPQLQTIALKSGETVEITDLWFAINCKSQLKSTPTVEILEGPQEVTASVKEAMVLPRAQNCNKPINGGKLSITAKDVEDYSTSKLTVRINYETKDGDRKVSLSYNISLFPKQ